MFKIVFKYFITCYYSPFLAGQACGYTFFFFFIRTSNFRPRLDCSKFFGDFSLKLFLNCSYFLIFLNSELVTRKNTCKMAQRNIFLKLYIQRSRMWFMWRACLSLFQRRMAPDGQAKFWSTSFVFMYFSICVQGLNKFLKFFWSKFQPGDCS